MFELKEMTVEAFINDTSIVLPRFQRAQTWNPKKNFGLCISLYKDYPLGVVVINVERNDVSGRFQKWLLDGRQRRNALTLMENPEEIYKWAKKFIDFKIRDTEEELSKKFWIKIDEFFDDTDENDNNESNHNTLEGKKILEDEDESSDESELSDEVHGESIEFERSDFDDIDYEPADDLTERKRADLKRLLNVILMVHPIRGEQSGLTRPFDFSKFVTGLDYIEGSENSKKVNTQQLLIWLNYKSEMAIKKGQLYPPSQKQFFEWITQGTTKLKSDEQIEREIDRRWSTINNVMNVLDSLNLQIKEGKIGYIQLKNTDDNDAKKIFELINTGGTPLEAAEILSAKPSWNIPVVNTSDQIKNNIKELYSELDVPQPNDVVKWDIAATVMKRININFIL